MEAEGPMRRRAAARVLVAAAVAALAGCATGDPNDPVLGRLEPRTGFPQTTELITRPGPGGGVYLNTLAGGNRNDNAVGLSAAETDKLIGALGSALKKWHSYAAERPFRQMVHLGAMGTGRANPFTLELFKEPGMAEPQFVITLALSDGLARFVFDRANAHRWGLQLAKAAGY